MDREARLEKYGSIIHCARKNRLCMAVDREGDGSCTAESCYLEQPGYYEKQKQIEENRRAKEQAAIQNQQEEKEASTNIRIRTKGIDIDQKIADLKKQMNREYTRGHPETGDRLCREIGVLERRYKR